MRSVAFSVACLVLVAGVVAAEVPDREAFRQVAGDRTIEVGAVGKPGTIDREAMRREIEDLHSWLMAEQVVAGIENPFTVELTAKELEDIEFGADTAHLRQPQAQRVGIAKPVAVEFALGNPGWGAVGKTFEGGRVWSGAVRSVGAFALRVHFDSFWLPPGTELYLFNGHGEVFGPYTDAGPLGTGEFWSHTVRGELAYLQLRQYGPAGPDKLFNTYFDIADIGHVSGAFGARHGGLATKDFCSYNEYCVENAGCFNLAAGIADTQDAVAHMQYVKRPYLYICSGGLVNNTSGDMTPYFLTANHCISRDREASTLEAYFFYKVECNQQCPEQWSQPSTPRTLGASVVSTNRTGDYTLLLLDQPAPAGTKFLGWSATPIAFTDNVELYRISHPSGSPQAYSKHVVDTSYGTCSSWPRGAWIYSRDVLGATEGGSSGSPVVNGQGQIVGQLSGGCGTNIGDTCDWQSNATVDGAFAGYFAEVAPWLDPAGCDDADGDGYTDAACGGPDCDDGDPAVNPGAVEDCSNGIDDDCDGLIDDQDPDCDSCTPSPEVCDDGIDNDCDGLIDEADPDCQECAPAGGTCTTGSDCCSGRCHPRKLTCR